MLVMTVIRMVTWPPGRRSDRRLGRGAGHPGWGYGLGGGVHCRLRDVGPGHPRPAPRRAALGPGVVAGQGLAGHRPLRRLGPTRGPVFLAERAPTRATPTMDVCPDTGRARLSYRRAAELFAHATTPLAAAGQPTGWTLHQLRHSALLCTDPRRRERHQHPDAARAVPARLHALPRALRPPRPRSPRPPRRSHRPRRPTTTRPLETHPAAEPIARHPLASPKLSRSPSVALVVRVGKSAAAYRAPGGVRGRR